jgi:hypothetical protein
MPALDRTLKIDFSQFDASDLGKTENYLLRSLGTGVVPDAKDPTCLEYMEFACQLEGHLLNNKRDRDAYLLWKRVHKAVAKSESRFRYHIYKGHILVRIALSSLPAGADLDEFLDVLRQAYEEDKAYYNNPDRRSAYKILSFVHPIAMFKNDLWPCERDVRKQLANRLVIALSMNRSRVGMAFHPDAVKKTLAECIPTNPALLTVAKENAQEMLDAAEAAEKKHAFAKSVMFLIGGIVESVLLDLATRCRAKKVGTQAKEDDESAIDLARASIKQLAARLRQIGVIDQKTEYLCRFIQHYRDFIHLPRNVKHHYRLDLNFHKMFFLFSLMLLEDLAKASTALA